MTRPAIRTTFEAMIFLGLAVTAHLAIMWTMPAGDPGSSGEGGDAAITLAASSAQIAEMVAALDTPPQIVEVDITPVEMPPAPTTNALPQPPMAALTPRPTPTPSMPQLAPITAPGLSLPTAMAPPPAIVAPPPLPKATPVTEPAIKPVEQPVAKTATADTPRPRQKPKPPAKPTQAKAAAKPAAPEAPNSGKGTVTSAGTAAKVAKGKGQSAQAGAGNTGTASLSPAKRANLLTVWGNKFRARVERRQVKPRGVNEGGRVLVYVSATGDGKIQNLGIAKSSGVAALDEAALTAVRRAGRFPKGPKQLGQGPHTFTFPIDYQARR